MSAEADRAPGGAQLEGGIFALPRSARFAGREWAMRTDFREVLTILQALEDPELTDGEKVYVCLHNLYEDFEVMPRSARGEAWAAAVSFIDGGRAEPGPAGRLMDWTQDAPILFPAVNRVAGYEVREAEYLHWWTFLGFFLEIREGTFATVLALRQKKRRGKKLEGGEREFWREHRGLCVLKARETAQEKAERERLSAMLGRV